MADSTTNIGRIHVHQGIMASVTNDRALTAQRRKGYHHPVFFGHSNNYLYNIVSKIKKMVEAKIVWVISTYFGIPMYVLAIIDSWDTWKGKALLIFGIIIGVLKFAKYLFDGIEAVEKFFERRKERIENHKLGNPKHKRNGRI